MPVSVQEQIRRLSEKLDAIEREKDSLKRELLKLQGLSSTYAAEEKISIFLNLFKGREDVFPRRWDSQKTGKSGYAPACGNEWVRGICEKPRIKCGECHHQAFLPLDKENIRKHLIGERALCHLVSG